jgi:hypothetical protein
VGYLTSCLLLSCCFRFACWLLSGCLLSAVALALLRMLFAVGYEGYDGQYIVEYFVDFYEGYLASCWLLPGYCLVAFRLRGGCLLFAVAVVLLRMMFAEVYFVECVVEYLMEYIVGYLASRWLLSVYVMVAFWLLSGCFLHAVAVMLLRMLFDVA